MIEIVPIAAASPADVEALLDRAFGTDRFARTAYRIRGDAAAIEDASFAAIDHGALVGSVQCWPVEFEPDEGRRVPLVMLGPIAVSPERRRCGIGRRLTARAIEAAPGDALILIGDPEYYGRFFGFDAARTGSWRVPGPVDRRRLLTRGEAPCGSGQLGPAAAGSPGGPDNEAAHAARY